MKKALVMALLAFLVPLAGTGKEPPGVKGLMKKKLQHSQKVLEGIATNDFRMIAKHADDLLLVSKAAGWRALGTRFLGLGSPVGEPHHE